MPFDDFGECYETTVGSVDLAGNSTWTCFSILTEMANVIRNM